MRTSLRSIAQLALLLALAAGCGRDELLSVDPREAPGQSAPTLEAILAPADLPSWIDTVFFGFTGPSVATFLQVEEGTSELISRGLIGFGSIQDSVILADTVSGVQRYDSVRVVLSLDTTRTVLASAGTTLQLRAVEQEWHAGSANWDLAVDTPGASIPWTSGPGGSFGAVLAELTVSEFSDSLIMELGASADSLLRVWADTAMANNGLAVVVGDSGRVVLQRPRMYYRIIPELQPDTAFTLLRLASSGTFILDRSSLSATAGVMRIGGIEGWRSFAELVLPDSVPVIGSSERVRLRGTTINRAELVLRSLDPPAAPFAAEDSIFGSAFELADDFRLFGPKTPVGARITGSLFSIDPSALTAASEFPIDITLRIQIWANVPSDSVPGPVRLVVRARPEATTFGFWEFGGADGDPVFAPRLRILFTPPVEFTVP